MKKIIQTKLGEVLIRPMQISDIDNFMNYLYRSSKEFLESIGFDLSKFKEENEFRGIIKNKIQRNLELSDEDKKFTNLVGELAGAGISQVSLFPNPGAETAHAHFHIWKESLRGQGLGIPILKASLKLLLIHQGRNIAYAEPHRDNKPVNRLIEKCGFHYVEDSVYSSPVTREFPSKKYIIKLSDL